MLFEARALSAQQASGAIPALPAPVSTSTCGIKACKGETRHRDTRGQASLWDEPPPSTDLRESMS